MMLRWVSRPTESSRVPKRSVPPRLGCFFPAAASCGGSPTIAAPASAVVDLRNLRLLCSVPFLFSSVMDEASLFEVFWAESGYVIGRLLDAVLQWGLRDADS